MSIGSYNPLVICLLNILAALIHENVYTFLGSEVLEMSGCSIGTDDVGDDFLITTGTVIYIYCAYSYSLCDFFMESLIACGDR